MGGGISGITEVDLGSIEVRDSSFPFDLGAVAGCCGSSEGGFSSEP